MCVCVPLLIAYLYIHINLKEVANEIIIFCLQYKKKEEEEKGEKDEKEIKKNPVNVF